MSAHDTNNGKKISKHDGRHQNIPIKFKPLNSGIFRNKNLVLLHPLQSLLSLKSKKQCKYTGCQLVRDCMKVNHFHVHIQEIQNNKLSIENHNKELHRYIQVYNLCLPISKKLCRRACLHRFFKTCIFWSIKFINDGTIHTTCSNNNDA